MSETTRNLEDYFDAVAVAFRDQNWATFEGMLQVPMTLAVGTGRMHCETSAEVIAVLRQYRQNLAVEGYAFTTAKVVADDPAEESERRVLVHWQHINRNGACFRQIHASYFMRRTPSGGWLKTQIEFVDDVPDRLAAGLPIDGKAPPVA